MKEYWIIDPERQLIEVLELANGAYRVHAHVTDAEPAHSKLLEGFAVRFNQLLV